MPPATSTSVGRTHPRRAHLIVIIRTVFLRWIFSARSGRCLGLFLEGLSILSYPIPSDIVRDGGATRYVKCIKSPPFIPNPVSSTSTPTSTPPSQTTVDERCRLRRHRRRRHPVTTYATPFHASKILLDLRFVRPLFAKIRTFFTTFSTVVITPEGDTDVLDVVTVFICKIVPSSCRCRSVDDAFTGDPCTVGRFGARTFRPIAC